MRAVGVFIAIAGILIFVTRAPGVFIPRAYRKFILDRLDNSPRQIRWLGRFLLLYAVSFIAVTYFNYSYLNALAAFIAICIQLALLIGGTFLQFPAATRDMVVSFLPEEADMTRLLLFLASAFGGFIAAYGIMLILET